MFMRVGQSIDVSGVRTEILKNNNNNKFINPIYNFTCLNQTLYNTINQRDYKILGVPNGSKSNINNQILEISIANMVPFYLYKLINNRAKIAYY